MSRPLHGKARRRKLAIGASVSLVLYGAACWLAAGYLMRPVCRDTVPSKDWTPSQVTTADGTRLAVYERGPIEGKLVVLAHWYHGCAARISGLGSALYKRGYSVVIFDFRAHGASEGSATYAGSVEAQDLDAVLEGVRERRGSLQDVVVVGFSMGAAAAATSRHTPELSGLVLVSMYDILDRSYVNRWRLQVGFDPWPLDFGLRLALRLRSGHWLSEVRPIDSLPRFASIPVLMLHGVNDDHVGVAGIDALRSCSLGAIQHAFHPGEHTSMGPWSRSAALIEPIARFLGEHLGPP